MTPMTRGGAGVIAVSFLVALVGFAAPSSAQATISRTPWQMYRNPIVAPVPDYGTHGDPREYSHAPAIPAVDANHPPVNGNGGWIPAPNGSTIGFGDGNASRLRGYTCRQALDFTFFQTIVTIPVGTTVNEFKIEFSGMDDGSRITIFNSQYSAGLVIEGSYVYLGRTGTTNLKDYVVPGQNRVVITQVDDCAVGNNLQTANVVLNGTVVQAPTTGPPTFSRPFEVPNGACVCTPLLMNTNQNGAQNWFVKATPLGGPLTITVAAVAVAPGIAGNVRAQIFNIAANTLVADITASYTVGEAVPGFKALASASLDALPNAIYRVNVTTPSADPQQAHFQMKADGAQAIATGSPSAPSFEHEDVTWRFNVGTGESLKIDVLMANPPDPSVMVPYKLFSPTGALHSTGTMNAPGSITVPSAAPGTWALQVDPTTHYRLSKDGGADRGIYLAWDSVGEQTLKAVVTDGNTGGSFTGGPVELVVYNSANMEVARQVTTTGVANFGVEFETGIYKVRVFAPLGFTASQSEVTVMITCDGPAVANIVVADVTKPIIVALPNLTREAEGPDGAVVSWNPSATDPGRGPVPVTCTPLPGSTFSLGLTTVECTAVDLAGNKATPVTFTVNVVDTTAPSGVCTASFNPSGGNIPRASRQNEDGFYRVSSSDIVTASPSIKVGSYTLMQGETVKFTQSPGLNGVTFVGTMGPQSIRHFRVGPGDPVLTITDAAGNISTRTCFVAPVPK